MHTATNNDSVVVNVIRFLHYYLCLSCLEVSICLEVYLAYRLISARSRVNLQRPLSCMAAPYLFWATLHSGRLCSGRPTHLHPALVVAGPPTCILHLSSSVGPRIRLRATPAAAPATGTADKGACTASPCTARRTAHQYII